MKGASPSEPRLPASAIICSPKTLSRYKSRLLYQAQLTLSLTMQVLTPDELFGLTRRRRFSAQARVLTGLGIEFKRRIDGSIVVLHSTATSVLCPETTRQRAEVAKGRPSGLNLAWKAQMRQNSNGRKTPPNDAPSP